MIRKEVRGELGLLAVFGVFVIAFLWDIRDLPMEGKLLSYIAGPAALGLIALCARHALASARKSSVDFFPEVESPSPGELEQKQRGRKRIVFTVGMSLVLFASIWLLGFYFGSALMMFAWFACLKRLRPGTIAIAVVIPLSLYVAFELLFDMGLPKGELFKLMAG